jgi:hypothetical protein
MEMPPRKHSRRGLLTGTLLTAGSMTSSQLSFASSDKKNWSDQAGDVRALALIGDRYHNPDYIRVSLSKLFAELGIAVDFTIAYDELSANLLKKYKLLIILRDGMIWPNGYLGPDQYTAY